MNPAAPAPTLAALAEFLAEALATGGFPPDDPAGVWRPSARPVARLGLALEPWPGLAEWTRAGRLDALWLHRPWRLEEAAPTLSAAVGVLAHHLAFDERLTPGFNPRLGRALGLGDGLEGFGEKDGRPLGMTGRAGGGFEAFARCAAEVFAGLDLTVSPAGGGAAGIGSVAVVGAMTEALVRAAAARGVGVYLTGQWRQPAEAAVRATGLGVLAVGHGRAERWGLRALAGLLRERWAELEVVLEPARCGEANALPR